MPGKNHDSRKQSHLTINLHWAVVRQWSIDMFRISVEAKGRRRDSWAYEEPRVLSWAMEAPEVWQLWVPQWFRTSVDSWTTVVIRSVTHNCTTNIHLDPEASPVEIALSIVFNSKFLLDRATEKPYIKYLLPWPWTMFYTLLSSSQSSWLSNAREAFSTSLTERLAAVHCDWLSCYSTSSRLVRSEWFLDGCWWSYGCLCELFFGSWV